MGLRPPCPSSSARNRSTRVHSRLGGRVRRWTSGLPRCVQWQSDTSAGRQRRTPAPRHLRKSDRVYLPSDGGSERPRATTTAHACCWHGPRAS
eukprot:4266827-Pyramimonas_sp.AAC.1